MVLCKMDKILYNLSLILAKVEGVVSNQWTGLDCTTGLTILPQKSIFR